MEDGGGCSSGTRKYCMKGSVKRGICAGIPSGDVCCLGWIGDGGKKRWQKGAGRKKRGDGGGKKELRQ